MAGVLNRLIQFRRASVDDNGLNSSRKWFGDERDNYGVPIWGSKADLSDAERWRAGEVSAQITTRFRVRWSQFTSTLTPADRLICGGVTYDITGIKGASARDAWLEITAAARTDI